MSRQELKNNFRVICANSRYMYLSAFDQVPSDFNHETKYLAIMKELNKFVSPLGTKDNPAVSCKDIANCQGDQFSAGELMINFSH